MLDIFIMSVNIGSQQLSLPVDLVAQQLSSTNNQSAQVDLQPSFQNNVSVNFDSQQLPLSDMHQGLARGQSSGPVNLEAYPLQSVPMEPHFNPRTPMSSYVGSQQLSPTTRRPSGVQPSLNVETSIPIKMGSQHSPSTNKRPSHMEASPKFRSTMLIDPVASPKFRSTMLIDPVASPKFRSTMLIDPVSQQMSANKRPHLEPPSKFPTESFECVRSKLRESLTSALGMVAQQQSKIQSVDKSSPIDTTNARKQADVGAPSDEKNEVATNASSQETSSETLTSNEQYQKLIEARGFSLHTGRNETSSDETNTWKCDLQEYQSKNIPSDDKLSFNNSSTCKDEFLQGHGLCWAPEADVDYSEAMRNHSAKKSKLGLEEITENTKDIALLNAEKLATEIETELFKLFGGVNKKYKEKGRSLLFNLKDRSNPELRERVLSGDIAPERLCSMTAEELASKELSEWRLAKAEEFAHMVVLQDSQVDIRRLVRKTHKGEFQVEVEHDDNISVEVDLVANVLSQVSRKPNEVLASSNSSDTKALEGLQPAKGDSGDQNLSGDSDTQLHEHNDLVQDFIVDELKETEFLPPIVSLDVFMEDLDKEPPFDSLPMDNEQDIPSAEKGSITLDPEMKPASEILESEMSPVPNRLVSRSDPAPEGSGSESEADWQDMLVSKLDSFENITENPVGTPTYKISKMDEKYAGTGRNLKTESIHEQQDTFLANVASKSDYIWEGEIQLNISALATVTGFFRSGEKTSSLEWSGFIEIKGRVRLDAFEKFLQELPLSRSRAIMITHFFWKEGSPMVGRVNICEAVNSYVTDERVGFAEPAPGVEIYFCPPHPRTTEMLGRHLPKEHTVGLESVVDGLIGVVVWRRPVTVSHHKHKKHSSSRKHQDSAPKSSTPPAPPKILQPPLENEPNEDIPPGFGPRDDDDLPEFDFVNGIKHATVPTPSQVPVVGPCMPQVPPVEQMRELIHKYGHINNARRANQIQPWNDDDDIPEWQPSQTIRPQIPTLPPPPPLPMPQGYPQQTFVPNQNFPPHPMQATPQQFVPYGMPMQMQMQMQPQPQPQIGLVPGLPNVPPGWQTTPWLPPFNGVMQPSQSQYVGEGGQFPGVLQPQHNAMIWRPDNPRGFRYDLK